MVCTFRGFCPNRVATSDEDTGVLFARPRVHSPFWVEVSPDVWSYRLCAGAGGRWADRSWRRHAINYTQNKPDIGLTGGYVRISYRPKDFWTWPNGGCTEGYKDGHRRNVRSQNVDRTNRTYAHMWVDEGVCSVGYICRYKRAKQTSAYVGICPSTRGQKGSYSGIEGHRGFCSGKRVFSMGKMGRCGAVAVKREL